MGGLDMQIRMGDAEDSRVSRFEGLGTGGAISNAIVSHEGTKDTAAARTAPMGSRWRGLRRTQISLGDNKHYREDHQQ
jgi:hypothetical protein